MKLLSILLSTLFISSSFATSEQECAEKPGYRWDSNLGCIVTEQVIPVREGAKECEGLSADELSNCLADVARNSSKTIDKEIESMAQNRIFKVGVPLIMTMLAGHFSLKYAKEFKSGSCAKASMFVLTGSAIAATAGEFIARGYHRKKLKDAREEYKKSVDQSAIEATQGETEDRLTDNQTKAFRFLKRIEAVREESEKIRRAAHTVSSAGFAAVSLLAIYEMAQSALSPSPGVCRISMRKTAASSIGPKEESLSTELIPGLENYHFLDKVTLTEYKEIILQTLHSAINLVIPSSIAADGLRKQVFNNGDIQIDLTSASKAEICKVINELNMFDDYAVGQSVTTAKAAGKKAITFLGKLAGGEVFNGCLENKDLGELDEVTLVSCSRSKGEVKMPDGSCGPGLKTDSFQEGNTQSPTAEKNTDQLEAYQKRKDNLAVEENKKPKIVQMMERPIARAGLGAVLGVGSLVLRKNANDNIQRSRKRQGQIQEIIDAYVNTGGSSFTRCNEEDRQDSKKVTCFCYNADGSKNLSRKNLVICNQQWGAGTSPLAANNYDSSTGFAANLTQACVSSSNQVDITCSCRANNSCLKKVPKFNLQGASVNWANQIGTDINKAFSGGLTSGQLNEGSLLNQARSINKKVKELGKTKKNRKVAAAIEKARRSITGSLSQLKPFNKVLAAGLTSPASGIASTPIKELRANPKKAIGEIERSLNKATISRKAGRTRDGMDLDFGEGTRGGVEIAEQVAKVMNKDFKIKGDINNNPDNNIFKILTNRYHSTGLKKLFEKEKPKQFESKK